MKSNFILLISILSMTNGYSQFKEMPPNNEIVYSLYSTGNLSTLQNNDNNLVLAAISKSMSKDVQKSTLLLLGNNASRDGFNVYKNSGKENLDSYIHLFSTFSNNVIFIPGNSDWRHGIDDLKAQERYLENALNNKNVFQPENGCPIKKIKINDKIDILILDSQWAISDWNRIPNINDNCDIKNKNDFYVEVEHEISKSQNKTVLVATYHPIATYGQFGNSFSFGINPQNINNKYYKEFSERLMTIARKSKNVIFLSGHEQNIQFIKDKDVPIIISGAAGEISNASDGKNSQFHYNESGFSKIIQFADGSIWVSFFGISNNFKFPLYSTELIRPQPIGGASIDYDTNIASTIYKSIYEPDELKRSGIYKALWGEHFRKDYETPIKLKSALLDTLYGGLSIIKKGGGHQTNSLRLEDKYGKQYVMRSAKKSALRFIQYFMFKTQYLEPDVEETYFIQLLQDYWTTANPFASLTLGDLSDALNIYHASTEIYYIPKQSALGIHNKDFGDNVYFLEERLNNAQEYTSSLGADNEIISTSDLLKKLRLKDHISIDQNLYIRSRLFDNLIGDWDRHEDQWRWKIQKQENGNDLYQPIPRDRDQAFSDFDGFVLAAVRLFNPPLRFMQRYDSTYNYTRWFNDAGDDVDLAVLTNHTQDDWLREAKYIKAHLTNEVIEQAFSEFPKEIDQVKAERTKNALLGRLSNIDKIAIDLYQYLRSTVIITGTDHEDFFQITRKPNGITNISIYRIINGKKGNKFWDVDYNHDITRELWVYGLDGSDIFEVNGKGNKYIGIRIIGGQNNDTFQIDNKKGVHVFDQKSNPNTFNTSVSKTLSDNYDLNTYYFKKNPRNISKIFPTLGYDPDNGVGFGLNYMLTKNSLIRNPFTSQHRLKATYFSETTGVNMDYTGEFANFFKDVNLGIEAVFNSPSSTDNFFGFGNETLNLDDALGFDYNRVRLQRLALSPSLIFRGYQGSEVKISLNYENVKIEQTEDRFIETTTVNPEVFEGQNFFGAEVYYQYQNFDNSAQPSCGIRFRLTSGIKSNFDEHRNFVYLIPELGLTFKVDANGILVFATKFKAKINLNDNYEFYQSASLGDGDGLRGFRQQRFSGKSSYYQNSDLRLSLGKFRNNIIPISFGVYGGMDYGRVWIENDTSDRWHITPGGGLFFNVAGFTSTNVAYFHSEDGGRLNIGLSFSF